MPDLPNPKDNAQEQYRNQERNLKRGYRIHPITLPILNLLSMGATWG